VNNLDYWDPFIERMPKSELIKLQEKKLRQLVAYVKDHSKIYRRKFKETKLDTDDIKTLDDLHKLPFTIKKDFRDNYPIGMLCVPDDQVIRYHASSGTTGKRTIVGYTRNDIHEWSTSLARGLTSLGVGRRDIIQNSYGYGLFTGGLGFHYGAEMVGATTLPTGAGMTERQLELMQDLGTTAFACTPSYFLHIAEVARNLGIDFSRDTKLKVGLFGAEPWSEDMRKRIEESTGINAYDVFGTSELNGPLFMECKYKNGIHIWADQYIVEIINPETSEPVSEGKKGELVVTTISKEAMPLIRYKIGDITYIDSEVCECGRTHPRLMRILGRADDMLIIRGINVFPGQIESVLMKNPELSENYQLVIDREHELDEMTIIVEITEKFSKVTKPRLLKIKQDIINDLRNVLNLSVEVKLEKPGSLPRSLGKAKRVIDNRKI